MRSNLCILMAAVTFIFGIDMQIPVLWIIAAGVWRDKNDAQPMDRAGVKWYDV